MRKIILACCLLATPVPVAAQSRYICIDDPFPMACFNRFRAANEAVPRDQKAIDAFFTGPGKNPEPDPRSASEIAASVDAIQARGAALRAEGYITSRIERNRTPCLSYGLCR